MAALGRSALGASGEDAAVAWYSARGYDILERNWRCRAGELDVVVRSGDLHVFCEVKTRTSDLFGTPAEAVGIAKQARLRRLAATWLRESPRAPGRWVPVRFDVAAVMSGSTLTIEMLEGAF